MTPSLMSIKKRSALPILAVAISFFLVAGQVFNCCRLNETFSESISKTLNRIGHWGDRPMAGSVALPAKTHTGCHGHPASVEPKTTSVHFANAPIQWKSGETCLSELDAVPEALQPSADPVLDPFFAAFRILESELDFTVPRFEKPRPQNRASPPIYLLTLRLLV